MSVDSGAGDHAFAIVDLPGHPVQESPGSRGGRASASTVDHGDERASAAAPLYRAKTAFEATEHWQLSLARGDALLLFDADRCVAVAVVIASG